MPSLRDLAAKAISAGFTGKGFKNASTETVKPSPRRAKIGNADFDKLGKRQQKIVRRMAVQGDSMVLTESCGYQLKHIAGGQRRCDLRAKDVAVIEALYRDIGTRGFRALQDAVRAHYL